MVSQDFNPIKRISALRLIKTFLKPRRVLLIIQQSTKSVDSIKLIANSPKKIVWLFLQNITFIFIKIQCKKKHPKHVKNHKCSHTHPNISKQKFAELVIAKLQQRFFYVNLRKTAKEVSSLFYPNGGQLDRPFPSKMNQCK